MRPILQNIFYSIKGNRYIILQLRRKIKQHGISFIFRKIVDTSINYFQYAIFKLLKSGKIRLFHERTFSFQGEVFHYFCDLYNTTWKNERSVEVPIVRRIMSQYDPVRILEVGNVLQHYFETTHTILDKYEKGKGVTNEDIIDFQTDRSFDLIICISTLEHVGYDEDTINGPKVLETVAKLRDSLSKNGKIVITFPLGVNPFLDEYIRNGSVKFTKIHCFKKITRDNRWLEVEFQDIREAKYDSPFPGCNGLIIGLIEENI